MKNQIVCLNYRPYSKGNLLGFMDLRIDPMKLVIKDCTLHQKDGARWINLPQKPYKDEQGETKYSYIVMIDDKEIFKAFCEQAKKALDTYCQAQGQKAQTPQDEPSLPF